jgi:hypothetical protein
MFVYGTLQQGTGSGLIKYGSGSILAQSGSTKSLNPDPCGSGYTTELFVIKLKNVLKSIKGR